MSAISSDVLRDLQLNVPTEQRNESLGQADFLRLMTEQLKNQDPMKPLSNNEFLGQLAQFSTVQGLQELQSIAAGFAQSMASDQALRGAALVGRNVLVATDQLALDGSGEPVDGMVAAAQTGTITIEIKSESGAVVRTLTVEADGAGDVDFQWDGLDDNGQPLAEGNYSMAAYSGAGDDKVQLETGVIAPVESVTVSAQGLILNLAGLGSVPMSAVIRIS